MEFGIEKCAMLLMKSGKRNKTDGVELTNQDKIRTLAENDTYKYIGILEAETIKQSEIKKNKKEYLRRPRKLVETKIVSRNLIKGLSYGLDTSLDIRGPFLSGPEMNLKKWTKEKEN